MGDDRPTSVDVFPTSEGLAMGIVRQVKAADSEQEAIEAVRPYANSTVAIRQAKKNDILTDEDCQDLIREHDNK